MGDIRADLENVNCPVCQADNAAHHLEVKGFSVVKCRDCSMAYINPRLKDQSIYNIYKDNYFLREGYTFEDFGYGDYDLTAHLRDRTFIRWYDEAIPYLKVKSGSALDVGCATGRFLMILKERNWKVNGIELDRGMCAELNEKGFDVNSEPLESQKAESTFDLITLFDVVEHLPHVREDFKVLHKLLSDDGSIVLVTPNIESLQSKIFGKRWFQLKPLEHISYFSPRTLKTMAEESGFKVVRAFSTGQYADLGFVNHRLSRYDFPILASIFDKIIGLFGLKDSSWYIGTGSTYMILQKA
ncbi:MAG: class I SAM-dependent methyltransferase [Flavobacteriales bacterium]|nr:class I SAM-dependent methyltransferase [Flavobacteriales bacterium]